MKVRDVGMPQDIIVGLTSEALPSILGIIGL